MELFNINKQEVKKNNIKDCNEIVVDIKVRIGNNIIFRDEVVYLDVNDVVKVFLN